MREYKPKAVAIDFPKMMKKKKKNKPKVQEAQRTETQ